MSKYFDLEKLKEMVEAKAETLIEGKQAFLYVSKWLDILPAADVEHVRHGHWIKVFPRRTGRNATYKCSVCKKLRSSYYNDVSEWDRCPCGAKMDGKENEEGAQNV